MSNKKKFKDTKVGKFLVQKGPSIIEAVGDVIPDAGVLGIVKKLIEKEKAFYEKNIANKENALLDMKDELSDLILSFRKKVGDGLPDNLLENKDDNQD